MIIATCASANGCRRRSGDTSYALVIDAIPVIHHPVPLGPRAYRSKLRGSGPFVALLPPAAMGCLSLLLLSAHTSLARGAAGFLTAVFAAPGLLVAGAPLRSGGVVYLGGVIGSGVLWMIVGVIAARRATRLPVASWRDYWREYVWLAVGVWLGALVALIAVNLVFGRALF
ncbi:MAG: hypothetical protein ABI706_18510 [Ilumatobacteraceae bacterium]